jgi:hypothetical protein
VSRFGLILLVFVLLQARTVPAEELVTDPEFRTFSSSEVSLVWQTDVEDGLVQPEAQDLSIRTKQASSSVYLSQEWPVDSASQGKVLALDLHVNAVAGRVMVFPWAQSLDAEGHKTVIADSVDGVILAGQAPQHRRLLMYVPHWTRRIIIGVGVTGAGQASIRALRGSWITQGELLVPDQAVLELDEFTAYVQQFGLTPHSPAFATVLERVRAETAFGVSRLAMDALLAYAVRAIGDGHSRLVSRTPETQGKVLPNEAIEVRQLPSGNGYVRVPAFSSAGGTVADFARAASEKIPALAASVSCGWVIDLRENSGGNMWPMLQGLSAFFADGEIGSFVKGKQKKVWHFVQGRIFLDEAPKGEDRASMTRRSVIDRPLAVLVSAHTASSGEAVAIALMANSRTVFLGRKTSGKTTNIDGALLSGGKQLLLASSEMRDIHGIGYPEGIYPQIAISSSGSDLVVAENWLVEQCGRETVSK